MASAPVLGDDLHVRWSNKFHVRWIFVEGGHIGTCKVTFRNCHRSGDATEEEDQRLIQGIIADIIIDVRGHINSGIPDNPLGDRVALFEHIALASLNKF